MRRTVLDAASMKPTKRKGKSMDLNTAICFGLLEKFTENILPDNLNNAAGQVIPISYGPMNISYKVITTIYGNDLATDLNPERGNQIVSFGLVLQDEDNNVVIAIRGTEGVWEWIHDAEFLQVPCPFLATAGKTEDGFTALYKSLRIAANPAASTVVNALATLPFKKPVGSMTIIGHSLGGALATLMALDVAANAGFKNPAVYTYASPRTGDPLFVDVYNAVVPNTVRIVNRIDIVPTLPASPPYAHVLGLYELNPVVFTPVPRVLVRFDLCCEHHITTYLYLLSLQSGGPVLPLDADCNP